MFEYSNYLILTFLLLFIVFIIGPKMVIPGLQLLIVKLQKSILNLELLFLMTVVRVYNAFSAKGSLNVGLYTHVNHALVATYQDDLKCVTAVGHRAFCGEDLLIVEEYDNEATARAGHEKWVKTFEKLLPRELRDITNGKVCKRKYFE